jgi:hypothetical protein
MNVACCQPISTTNSHRLCSQSTDQCVCVCTRKHCTDIQCANRTNALDCVMLKLVVMVLKLKTQFRVFSGVPFDNALSSSRCEGQGIESLVNASNFLEILSKPERLSITIPSF